VQLPATTLRVWLVARLNPQPPDDGHLAPPQPGNATTPLPPILELF